MSLRQIMLSLLRQRTDTMADNSDTNVVKIVIDEESCISLIVRQRMAEVTAGLRIEQFPPALCRVADGVCLSRGEMVEGGIECSESSLVGRNRAQHILLIHP